jgi:hypothetical protein
VTIPRLETGIDVSIVTPWLLGPVVEMMTGELSWTSRSERRRHRMTTWIFDSSSVFEVDCCWGFGVLAVLDDGGGRRLAMVVGSKSSDSIQQTRRVDT